MRRWHKVLLGGVVVVAAFVGFSVWYKAHYSMASARAFEVAGSASGPRVLLATQGSEFKDAVVAGVVEHLKARQAYVKVIDVSALPSTRESDWNAIVVVHTFEMRKPPPVVQAFFDKAGRSGKLVVLTTSGAGDFKPEGVDAISAASRMMDVPTRVNDISAKLDAILSAEVASR